MLRSESFNYENYARYLEPPRPCPVCCSEHREDWATSGSYRAVKCRNCGHVYIVQALSPQGLDQYYSDYIAFRLRNPEKMEQRARMYEIDRDILLRHVRSGRLLDIGCSSGEFLLVLGAHFDVYGVDRDPSAVDIARQRRDWLSDRIHEADFEHDPLDWLGGPVDVVVMRGVVEHLVNPALAIRRSAGLLHPGGVFFITATPNVECLCAEVFREKWNQFDAIQHLSYFSASTLARLMAEVDIHLEAQYYPYLETPYARPAEDLRVVREAIALDAMGRRSEMPRSPSFWGNMMTLVFRKDRLATPA